MQADIIGGLGGGVLIGLASILLFASSGRIAGISGIMGGLYGKWNDTERLWRLMFLVGLICGAGIVSLAKNGLEIRVQSDGMILVAAGLLVGFGTRLGGGCTSGHGVCGLARRSKRSVFATLTFITVAMVTVFIIRHILQ
ncbi:MAG: putative membrane protein YedE/YeeE [Gammaproteobacteria bacterium]|jgi:uncharacterized membrane protein YedE/YeeE